MNLKGDGSLRGECAGVGGGGGRSEATSDGCRVSQGGAQWVVSFSGELCRMRTEVVAAVLVGGLVRVTGGETIVALEPEGME